MKELWLFFYLTEFKLGGGRVMSDKIVDMMKDAVEEGYTPSEIKESVIDTLGVYFENKATLCQYATSSEILSVYEFIIRYHYDPSFITGVFEVLNCYRKAYKIQPDKTLEVIVSTLKEFTQKENLMWTVRQQTPNNPTTDIYDAVIAYYKHIGDTLEIGTKHIVFELYTLIRYIVGKPADYEEIHKYKFGVVINNILVQGYFNDILKTIPISIKLSDWRNISYHHTYSIEQGKIVCTYGRLKNTFEISYDELKKYTHQIVRASNILNVARCIFVFDNLDSIHLHLNINKDSVELRKPLLLNQLKISLSSQGFQLEHYDESENSISIVLYDLRNSGKLGSSEERERKIQSSQFLYNFWCVFQAISISIIYCNNKGIRLLCSSVQGEICRCIQDGQKELSYLAQHVDYKIY